MENGAKKHFVLVHGAWCWYKLSTLLKPAGHKVSVPDMAASGIHPKQVHEITSILDYFEPLMALMASLPPEERVILVGHSFGGVCLSAAMERFPEKISAAVFVTALVSGPNLTYLALTTEYGRRSESNTDNQYWFDEGPDKLPTSYLLGPNFSASNLYQLSPPEDLSLALSLMRPFKLYHDPQVDIDTAVTEGKYGSVRRVFVICKKNKSLEEEFQRWNIEKNPMDEVRIISGSDHMPMFSKPQELFNTLQQIANNCT